MKQIKCCPLCKTKFDFPLPKFQMLASDNRTWIVEETIYCSICSAYIPERIIQTLD